jgi:hypothetical protein
MPSRHAGERAKLVRTVAARPGILSVDLPPPWGNALAALHARYDDPALPLHITGEARSLSQFRFANAEHFFLGLEQGFPFEQRDLLYHAGIATQLAVSSHLLDVGFADAWCARHIGLRVAHSLAYANATGFDHPCPEMARLALVLSPYWKWNHTHRYNEPAPDDGGFSADKVGRLLRDLLDHVRHVTGHPLPHWRSRHNARRSRP